MLSSCNGVKLYIINQVYFNSFHGVDISVLSCYIKTSGFLYKDQQLFKSNWVIFFPLTSNFGYSMLELRGTPVTKEHRRKRLPRRETHTHKWDERSNRLEGGDGLWVQKSTKSFLAKWLRQPWVSRADTGKGKKGKAGAMPERLPTSCLRPGLTMARLYWRLLPGSLRTSSYPYCFSHLPDPFPFLPGTQFN